MWVMFSPEYLEYTLMGLILIPGITYATIVSIKVNTTFSKYEKVFSSTEELIKQIKSDLTLIA